MNTKLSGLTQWEVEATRAGGERFAFDKIKTKQMQIARCLRQ